MSVAEYEDNDQQIDDAADQADQEQSGRCKRVPMRFHGREDSAVVSTDFHVSEEVTGLDLPTLRCL